MLHRLLNGFKYILTVSSIFMLLAIVEPGLKAQDQKKITPGGAFLRSMVVPGWGHRYVDDTNWNRGKYHLAGEAVLILSYIGINVRANNLETDFRTLAQSRSGANLSDKDRDYLIALGNYDSLNDYNEAQLRSRRWNALFPESPEYQWTWESTEDRLQYQNTREKVDKTRNQLPTLVVLMIGNRITSGISAYLRAQNKLQNFPEAGLTYVDEPGYQGVAAKLRFNF
ncbi:MAG: hypothetical protein U5K71_05380 [Gracilimonas sp.]|nr:hypothetical protein [Gracilimonas sp.]